MNIPERRKERFLRDPLPVRLGGLAADLARVSSCAQHEGSNDTVAMMLEESQWFIEWTAAEAEPEIAAELVDIQVLIALWRRVWPEVQNHRMQRTILAVQAKKWSDQVLDYSGLLDEGSAL